MQITNSIKVTKAGKYNGLDFIRAIDKRIHFEFQERLLEIAQDAADKMQQIILDSKYNLEALAKEISVDIISTTAGVEIGIGKISDLPKGKNGQTYWQAFNDGFKPGASNSFLPLGSFEGEAPQTGKSGQRWETGSGSWTFFDRRLDKKPVEPMRFAEISYEELKSHINSEINKLNRTL